MKKNINLDMIAEDDLLKVRICDLPIVLDGTWVQACIEKLYKELEEKGLLFRPVCYLADEWLTPQYEPVIGIPFFLAHPTLVKLEKKMMLEAEGSTQDWCMKLLRHETGHAISYAYRLHRRKKMRDIFGSPSIEYPDTFRFRPHSKSFVRHLDGHYAQYHPDEDFVETFAVWLTPGLDWENQYKGWKAIKKLRYVDTLMKELVDKPPLVTTGKKYWHYSTKRIMLKNFYKKKRQFGAEDFPDFHDGNLKKIFVETGPETEKAPLAAGILLQYRKELLRNVAQWTGERKYVINDVFKTIIQRCRYLRLRVLDPESIAVQRVTAYITALIMNYVYTGWYRGDKEKRKRW